MYLCGTRRGGSNKIKLEFIPFYDFNFNFELGPNCKKKIINEKQNTILFSGNDYSDRFIQIKQ